jgi:hypothetical protein
LIAYTSSHSWVPSTCTMCITTWSPCGRSQRPFHSLLQSINLDGRKPRGYGLARTWSRNSIRTQSAYSRCQNSLPKGYLPTIDKSRQSYSLYIGHVPQPVIVLVEILLNCRASVANQVSEQSAKPRSSAWFEIGRQLHSPSMHSASSEPLPTLTP